MYLAVEGSQGADNADVKEFHRHKHWDIGMATKKNRTRRLQRRDFLGHQ